MKFSERLPKDLDPSPFFAELEQLKSATSSYIDMTVSSPLRVGLPVDLNPAVEASAREFGTWVADAAGRMDVREAVADYYRRRGGNFDAGQILLTASTSEAYSILFKTFCDPGDVILTPMPGYPLLDTLAQLEHLECAPYFLKLVREMPGSGLRSLAQLRNREARSQLPESSSGTGSSRDDMVEQKQFRFVIDTDSLLTAPERARILLLVSPHNPTGHCVSEKEWREIISFCEQNGLVLVVDEVFGDYPIRENVHRSWEYLQKDLDRGVKPKCPVFWLNGLSKAVGSPQLKLGWMAFYAPEEDFEPVRAALEFVSDAYLSVSAPAQALAKPLLQTSLEYEASIADRLKQNWNLLRENFSSKICPDVLGGWYAALRLGEDDEELTLRILREKQVLVQPGFFFDFEEDGWIVISLLQPPEIFKDAVMRLKSLK